MCTSKCTKPKTFCTLTKPDDSLFNQQEVTNISWRCVRSIGITSMQSQWKVEMTRAMIQAYQKWLAWVKEGKEYNLRKHILDKGASEEFKKAMKEQLKLEMMPTDMHRRNITEQAIQTFKGHFTTILSGVAENYFPVNQWNSWYSKQSWHSICQYYQMLWQDVSICLQT